MASFLKGLAKDVAKQTLTDGINKVLGGATAGDSSGFTPQNLLSSINKSGIAKTAHFEVQLVPPPEMLAPGAMELKELTYRADTCELPGRTISTIEHRFQNFGPFNKVPYSQMYGDSTISFLLSEDMREKEFFEMWQNAMVNTGAFEQGSDTSKFLTKYWDTYVGTVIIRQFGSSGDLRSIHTLEQAYPTMMGGVSMNWSDDAVAKLTITFAFKNYKAVFNKQNQPGLGFGFSLRLGKGGLQGSLRLPGIGSVAGGGGFGTNFNLGPLKSRISSGILKSVF